MIQLIIGLTCLAVLSALSGAVLMAMGQWDTGLIVWLVAILGWTSLFQWIGRKSEWM